ncbi:hypothetical protein MYSTI_07757 [Myxococcus stipitatus DSM 14675]|uniref:Uncharacterized protein n=1 Tax=Myxococcus stipitatus (strain DSM 14675 / JCM 12634 / Mx s8) TaxID=1278073 RepID=L7UR33_MYXSD|nr:hypothetical protein [Myxococcus stipitatus]AGC49029.1 hypothetical protein MYSTI_07757 [Myxococcus stipitatus DSM 14675]
MSKGYLVLFLDLPNGSLGAAFPPAGKGSVDLSNNFLGRQEIGYYEAELLPGAYARLKQLHGDLDFNALPVATELPPDTKTVSVGESPDGEDIDMRTFPLHSVPDALEPLLNEMREASEHMLTKPLRVLRGEGAPTSPRFPLEKSVSFAVTLRNVGSQAIEMENPFIPHAPGRANLRLLVSKDKPSEQLREGDVLWMELGLENVHPPEGKKPPEGRRVTLTPGAELRFVVRKKLLSAPGTYRAVLTYFTSRGERGLETMDGQLALDLGRFEVVQSPPQTQP